MRVINLIAAVALAIFALTFLAVPTFAGEPMDEAAFKQLLVDHSPWSLYWENSQADGTFKMSFSVGDNDAFTGKFFDNSGGRQDGVWKDIVVHDNKCVSFTSSTTGTKYDHCLEEDGTLKGTQEFTDWAGETFLGKTVARPAQ